MIFIRYFGGLGITAFKSEFGYARLIEMTKADGFHFHTGQRLL